MKPVLATIIILMTLLTLTAGSFAMNRMMNSNDHADCLAAIPGSVKCIGGMDPLQFAITHINALLGASLGVTSSFILILLISLVLLAWLTVPALSKLLPAVSFYLRVFIERNIRGIHKQRRWTSLLEKRDPSLTFAAST